MFDVAIVMPKPSCVAGATIDLGKSRRRLSGEVDAQLRPKDSSDNARRTMESFGVLTERVEK